MALYAAVSEACFTRDVLGSAVASRVVRRQGCPTVLGEAPAEGAGFATGCASRFRGVFEVTSVAAGQVLERSPKAAPPVTSRSFCE